VILAIKPYFVIPSDSQPRTLSEAKGRGRVMRGIITCTGREVGVEMKITYDAEADALYVYLRPTPEGGVKTR